MDTSGTYIKMRLKAIPDLGMGRPPEADDRCVFPATNIFIDAKGDWYYSTETEAVQLERQDQLQEMIGGFGWSGQLAKLDRWIQGVPFAQLQLLDTWEQLWLSFIMHEKYHKVWKAETWEVE